MSTVISQSQTGVPPPGKRKQLLTALQTSTIPTSRVPPRFTPASCHPSPRQRYDAPLPPCYFVCNPPAGCLGHDPDLPRVVGQKLRGSVRPDKPQKLRTSH